MIFKFPDSDIEKIIIENWTNEPLEFLLNYISTSIKEKRMHHSSNKELILVFDEFITIYKKNKKSDKWIIRKKIHEK
ncbi:MAG TPA: hypothetical protein DC057_16290 [Spirochaetia bacterium]|nr:hypothetical protein [Spirochaetia bacterium]